jgi:hypothetical protein
MLGFSKTLGTLDVEHDDQGEQETEKGRDRRRGSRTEEWECTCMWRVER